MAHSLTPDMAINCPVADSAIETIVNYQEPSEEDGFLDFDEISLALEDLEWSIERGGDLSRTQRMALREACCGKWFEGSILQIIRRSKAPAEDRKREYEDLCEWIDESNRREEKLESADRRARGVDFLRKGEDRRIRASGYEKRIKRNRVKKPEQIRREQERNFIRSRDFCGCE